MGRFIINVTQDSDWLVAKVGPAWVRENGGVMILYVEVGVFVSEKALATGVLYKVFKIILIVVLT